MLVRIKPSTKAFVLKPTLRPLLSAGVSLCALMMLNGCSTLESISEKTSDAASSLFAQHNAQNFASRVYAGASAGSTRLSPDTDGTRYTISDREGASTQLRLGVDVSPLLSMELDTSVLGSATVREVEADVSYTSITSSALFYGLGDARKRSHRQGWQGYGRLGYSLVQRASIVQPFDGSKSNVLLGVGAEYGFGNGLAFRGEVTRFDEDATMFGLGVVYRLGMSARQFGNVVASVAKDAVPSTSNPTFEPSLGAALPSNEAAPGHVSLVHQGPHASLWSQPVQQGDSDGDSVSDSVDLCKDTAKNTAVSQNGCGLFDSILSNVTFKPGTHWLSPKSRGAIDEVVDVLLAFPEARIEVQAHADNQGPEEINHIVSTARADAVVNYMIKQGVGAKQLVAKGYGEAKPIASNDTAEGRQANRRVQLVTLPSLTPLEIASQSPLSQASSTVASTSAASKPSSKKMDVTMKTDDILALANMAEGMDRAPGVNANDSAVNGEPVLGAALPAKSLRDSALLPAIRISSLGLGGPLRGVKFKPGTTDLEASAKSELAKVSEQLKMHSQVKVALMVHVNEPADNVANLSLSRDQANTLVDYLASQGIDRRRLLAEAYGDALPVAQSVTESDRNRNRRIEVRVINPPGR